MPIIPDPDWSKPADSWETLIERYTNHIQMKAWRGRTLKADGTGTKDCVQPETATRLRMQLAIFIAPLVEAGRLPVVGHPIDQTTIDAVLDGARHTTRRVDKCPRWIWHLWRAMIFNRD
jgi:hypothetical protein